MQVDIEKFVDGLHDYIARAVKPIHERLAELEARKPEKGDKGEPGQNGINGIDGKSFTVEDVEPIIERAMEQKVDSWALQFERRAQDVLQKALDRIPLPKDGKDGVDGNPGADGMGFDDLAIEYDGERCISISLQKDGREIHKYLHLPIVIDRGVFKTEQKYQQGDGVTWAGSYWIAQASEPEGTPGSSDGWRLAVKKGRDGRHGRPE